MSIDTVNDPRSTLVRTKYFSLHPKPLERWLWKQGIPQTAERVFWLHWEEGMRSGDWCSEIPIKRVARECAVDPSTITRAYQVLKSLGLIRREDPGRDPLNPFQQATAVTEVRLPHELLVDLARSPNRTTKERGDDARAASLPDPAQVAAVAPQTLPAPSDRQSRQQLQSLWERVSADERARFFAASRDRRTAFEFDANTRLGPEDRGQLLAQLAQLATARPTPAAPSPAVSRPKVDTSKPRKLSTLDRARARRSVLEYAPEDAGGSELLRQVLWAIEEGALRRFAVPMALNIALKKIREGAWTKPNRLPPNWLPAVPAARAVPEQCSAA